MKTVLRALVTILIMVSAVPFLSSCAPASESGLLSMSDEIQSGNSGETSLQSAIISDLEEAKQHTDDKDIQNRLDVIIDRVRNLESVELTGAEEEIINAKRYIAQLTETLINDLPLLTTELTDHTDLSSGTTMYGTLVGIRAKIEGLLRAEPIGDSFPNYSITLRPPGMEDLNFYSTRFLCGPVLGSGDTQRGSYSTKVSIYNPQNETVTMYGKAVMANQEDYILDAEYPFRTIYPFRIVQLGPGEVFDIGCLDIFNLLSLKQNSPKITAPTMEDVENEVSMHQEESAAGFANLDISAIQPVSGVVEFLEGFLLIYASEPLEIVVTHSVSNTSGVDINIEHLLPSNVYTSSEPDADEAELPQDCLCLTEAAAIEEGYSWYQGEIIECGRDPTNGATMYCFDKVKCPEGCSCMPPSIASEGNLSPCTDQEIRCGDETYCYEQPAEESDCPQSCTCLTDLEAKAKGYDLCDGHRTPCGYEEGTSQKWCYQKTNLESITVDPEWDANRIGTEHVVTIRVYDIYGDPVPDIYVMVQVTGANNYSDTVTTDVNGIAYFGYSGTEVGEDTITATTGSISVTAINEWHHRYTGYNSGRLPDDLKSN